MSRLLLHRSLHLPSLAACRRPLSTSYIASEQPPVAAAGNSSARPSNAQQEPFAAATADNSAARLRDAQQLLSASAAEDQNTGLHGDEAAAPKKSRGVLMFGGLLALTAAAGASGYATYAYSMDEIEKKTNDLRTLSNYFVGTDASTFDKLQASVYSVAMKISLKPMELYVDMRKFIEEHVRDFTEPSSDKLLPDLHPQAQNVFTLVLDLNETLVYSDWKRDRGWRTFKRPGVDAFLEHLAKFYEIVLYSDQLSMYVEPVVERLDRKGCIMYRLSRPATRYQDGKHYRDLSKLNRDPSRIIYVSGHALENSLQPENSVLIKPWKLEEEDTALLDLIPFLEFIALHRPPDIRQVLASYQGRDIATEFIERSKEHQRRMQLQKGLWRR